MNGFFGPATALMARLRGIRDARPPLRVADLALQGRLGMEALGPRALLRMGQQAGHLIAHARGRGDAVEELAALGRRQRHRLVEQGPHGRPVGLTVCGRPCRLRW